MRPNQNKQKHPFGCFYLFLGARIRQSEAHGEYADEQLATAQKWIFLIEFLRGVGYCLSRSRAHSRELLWCVGKKNMAFNKKIC